ncbi:SDR family oxidoreductase [bacterium]|nr:SDR family oxidoreductase [bacterium]
MTDYLKNFSLSGKVAFVAGGTGLIGTEISKALASSGADTVIMDINKRAGKRLEKEIINSGYNASFEYFDVTDLDNIEKNINRLIKKYKSIGVLVNATYPYTKDWGNPVEKVSVASWRKNIDMHLNSYAWISRCAALAMQKMKIRGSIINLGSIYGVQGNDFTVYDGTDIISPLAYSAIKGGIINFTRYLASYFGRNGIRVNNLCPGGIYDNQNKLFVKRFVKNYEHKVPLKRMGKPEDVASVALFLASDASSYITGATIMVDGGWTIV